MAETKRAFTLRSIILMIVVVFIFPFLPMIISGVWDWWEAWAYGIIGVFGFIISRARAARRHPDILIERSRSIELQDAKPWDKILAPMLAFGSLFILIVTGLDKLFGWTSPYSLPAKVISLIVILLGFVLGSWALIENRFFSGVVRIQNDRGHYVVTTGPYRLVRHPGYAGALWTYLAMPIFLDSTWAFIPAILLLVILVVRTSMEDATLQAELPGYKEYAQRTKYRLLPGIW
ncbi:MAG TPA: isoprenylcysteine carboxylmethyltransferase family protein [Anaerolineales bacterium]|nr:isoprenylcysteine carboxylmethyltransferase family protein [Anaerolineales bacterium]HNB37130.1 isoprenylcysteine carboxylmethyltransferase family protein [Anaerolineales bacterium]